MSFNAYKYASMLVCVQTKQDKKTDRNLTGPCLFPPGWNVSYEL